MIIPKNVELTTVQAADVLDVSLPDRTFGCKENPTPQGREASPHPSGRCNGL